MRAVRHTTRLRGGGGGGRGGRRVAPPGIMPLGSLILLLAATVPAQAQLTIGRRTPGQAPAAPLNRTDPVTFTADEVQYDRDHALVTASGNVEAWQNDHVLRADRITFDRNTNVAAAEGHVVIVEPDGQVLFSDYAELTEGLRDGVLKGMRAILAENGKLAANGARRVEGKVNELSRAVYTTCNLCAVDPTRPPLWQIRARTAVQDTENSASSTAMRCWTCGGSRWRRSRISGTRTRPCGGPAGSWCRRSGKASTWGRSCRSRTTT